MVVQVLEEVVLGFVADGALPSGNSLTTFLVGAGDGKYSTVVWFSLVYGVSTSTIRSPDDSM